MPASQETQKIRNEIIAFEKRINEMHLEFDKYRHGDAEKMPEWERLERDLFYFSKRKIFSLELSNNLDRIMHKFQNRKKIWLNWAEEYQRSAK